MKEEDIAYDRYTHNSWKLLQTKDLDFWEKYLKGDEKKSVNFKKVLELSDKLGFETIWDESISVPGTADIDFKNGKHKIRYNHMATPYTILHELGHCIYGNYGCCREHDEYIAHGIAICLAKMNNITLDHNTMYFLMETYAGSSAHEACGAIHKNKEGIDEK